MATHRLSRQASKYKEEQPSGMTRDKAIAIAACASTALAVLALVALLVA